MRTSRRLATAVLLGLASAPANAQHGVPVWLFVAMASPLLVLILVAIYGWLAKAMRASVVHSALLVVWTVWFWLASNHNEVTLLGISTDYVIWTALALYLLHTILIVILVFIHASRRIRLRTAARSSHQ
jgi:hypothetical protein